MIIKQQDTESALAERLEFTRKVAFAAGEIALKGFRSRAPSDIVMKGQQDFLTESDEAVEIFIKNEIKTVFPDDDFLGEETGGQVSGRAVWVIDPIDGTANFARGIAHFCVSISFVKEGVVEIGAIYSPATEEFWIARRGFGATLNGVPIAVAATRDGGSACLELGWNDRRSQSDYLTVLERLLDYGANLRRAASGALALAYVSDGRSDGYIELHMHAWDCLAGLLLVEEAGGRVSQLPVDGLLDGGAVLAVAPEMANELSQVTGITLVSDTADQPNRTRLRV